jgi:hypothetical protein
MILSVSFSRFCPQLLSFQRFCPASPANLMIPEDHTGRVYLFPAEIRVHPHLAAQRRKNTAQSCPELVEGASALWEAEVD